MIIACPACSTRYVVPDSAIGADGRTVRCAKCRHSWFQDGPELPPRAQADEGAVPPPQPVATRQQEPSPASPEAAGMAYRDDDLPEPPAMPRGRARKEAAAFTQEAPSSFEHEPPFRPRRNTGKLWTIAAAAFAASVAGLIGLAAIFGLPDWLPMARPTFAAAPRDLELSFPPERQDRRTLPNGTEYFGASGTVTNIGKDIQEVPPILIVLRNDKDRVVYTWNVSPPRESLRPGESVTINEAVTDVPKSASVAEIGWKPD
jgi:predicted Zn finger-like uncharacterized protein